MLSFECDYNNGAHPDVLRALVDTNDETTATYGFDVYTERAKQKIREACETPDAQIYFLAGGTQTNATVIDGILRSYEAVITIETGHIAVHESGAIEHSGHKVITLPSNEGRLDADELEQWMRTFEGDESRDHVAQPGAVYISLPTELGTLYTAAQLEAIYATCRAHQLRLFVDGARLGYGLAASDGDLTLPRLARLCDVFYIGGTKVGALCGEAVVFPRGDAPRGFFSLIKQHGALFAKGRLCGVQFDALFTDGLYLRIAQNAIDRARQLVALFRQRGYRFYLDSPTNQQFVILPNEQMHQLEQRVEFTHWGPYDADHFICRFVTSWATTEAHLAALEALL
ncbi:MAG: aminotransferase class V-fold PLP-dependent enzyme [Prevotella sp.]|nr:aminotransferase class V-fold PLP-dependent enzyme [Prevotella sp.]